MNERWSRITEHHTERRITWAVGDLDRGVRAKGVARTVAEARAAVRAARFALWGDEDE